MAESAFKVLLDLSYATLGYSGIPQETRLLLKMMASRPGIEPTGLLFGVNDSVVGHRFTRSTDPARQAENQALYLQSLLGKEARPSFAPARWWKSLKTLWRLTLGRKVRLQRLDNERLWDVVWRNLLDKTLPPHDIGLAQRCPMLLANLGTRMLAARAIYHLPAPRLDTRGFDAVLFHDSRAVKVSPGTRKLIRYYDMIPGMRPDFMASPLPVKGHFRALRRCRRDSFFVCISEPTRTDLLRVFPELADRAVVIPCGLSDAYYRQLQPQRLPFIVNSRKSAAAEVHPAKAMQRSWARGRLPPYLLMVSTLEPRKNHVALIRAFETIAARHPDLLLVIVGSPGWMYDKVLSAMAPLIEQGRLFHLEQVCPDELRILYSHAEALVFPSLYEGFGYSPLEAMQCGTPAIASDIASHRWAYGDAVLYCDPYRVDSIADALERLLYGKLELRHELVERGTRRASRYRLDNVAQLWAQLFEHFQRRPAAPPAHADQVRDLNDTLRRGVEEREEEATALHARFFPEPETAVAQPCAAFSRSRGVLSANTSRRAPERPFAQRVFRPAEDWDKLPSGKAALIVAHPGHELRVYGWMTRVVPEVFVLTDGTGRGRRPRLDSSARVLQTIQAKQAAVFGRIPDHRLYDAVLARSHCLMIDLARELADGLCESAIDYVLGDAAEGRILAHDLCRLLIDTAVALARQRSRRRLGNYDFSPDGGDRPHDAGVLAFRLGPTLSARKQAVVRDYADIQDEVSVIEHDHGLSLYGNEFLRPVPSLFALPYFADDKPVYEVHGERLVAEGHYREVIRYREHVVPLVDALWNEVQRGGR